MSFRPRALRLASITFALLHIASEASAATGPSVRFESHTWEFGHIPAGQVLQKEFFYVNDGDMPLLLEAVKPSCGCTVASFSREPLPPGGRASLVISFNSRGRRGVQQRSIAVRCNDPLRPNFELTVSGVVDAGPAATLRTFPARLDAGRVEGGTKTLQATIANAGSSPLKIQSIETSAPYLRGVLEPAGDIAAGGQATLRLTLDEVPGLQPGAFEEIVTLVSNDPDSPRTSLPLLGYRLGAARGRIAAPNTLDVGVVKTPGKKLFDLPLINTGERPIHIRRWVLVGSGTSLPPPAPFVLEPGATHTIAVTSAIHAADGTFRDRLQFYDSDELAAAPVTTVIVSGLWERER